jgi:hypothetical protein
MWAAAGVAAWSLATLLFRPSSGDPPDHPDRAWPCAGVGAEQQQASRSAPPPQDRQRCLDDGLGAVDVGLVHPQGCF